MVTEQEARDMKTAIESFMNKDLETIKNQTDANKAIALTWFNGLRIDIQTATTREQALVNYNAIESLLKTETERFRLVILREKKEEANEKYRELKRIG